MPQAAAQAASWRQPLAATPPAARRSRAAAACGTALRQLRGSAASARSGCNLRIASRPERPTGGTSVAAAGNGAAAEQQQQLQRGQGPVEGVVIVDHGSRKAESNDMLLEFVELYKRVTGRALVEGAHMELAEPTVEQAVGRCAAAGATRVIIAPYFLSRGRHVQHDIPGLAAAAAAAHPSVECVVAEPIGIDSLMAQLIESRVAAAAQHGAAVAPPVAAAGAAARSSSGSD